MDNVGASDLNRTELDDPAVVRVLLRLLDMDELGKMYWNTKSPLCQRIYPSGVVCTRHKGHGGPHVAHGSVHRALAVWFDGE